MTGSGLITQRVLTPAVANIILGARQNNYGLRTVNNYRGVHFKLDPDTPGHEFAVDCLNKLISGRGSAPSELVKIDMGSRSFSLQASKTVDGVNMKALLEQRPDLLSLQENAFLLEDYSFSFVLGLLTNLNDAKPENFVVKLSRSRRGAAVSYEGIHGLAFGADVDSNNFGGAEDEQGEYEWGLKAVGVDNDMAFADPIGVTYEMKNDKGEWVGWGTCCCVIPSVSDARYEWSQGIIENGGVRGSRFAQEILCKCQKYLLLHGTPPSLPPPLTCHRLTRCSHMPTCRSIRMFGIDCCTSSPLSCCWSGCACCINRMSTTRPPHDALQRLPQERGRRKS